MFRFHAVACCLLLSAVVAEAQSPCALLTKAEVQDAVGVAVSDGVINTTNKAICDYKVGSGGSLLNLSVTPRGPADTAEKMVAELNKRKMPAQLLPGVGDGAYTSSAGYGMQQVGAYKGGKHVIATVLIFGSPEAKSKAIAEKLVRKAVSKL
jgi:hypothetical protein